jgi:hypothetical protein
MVFLFQCACNSSYLLGSSSALFYIIHNFIQLKIILHHITDVYNSVSNRLQPKQNCFNLNWETPRFSSQYMYTIDCRLHISQVLVVLPSFTFKIKGMTRIHYLQYLETGYRDLEYKIHKINK